MRLTETRRQREEEEEGEGETAIHFIEQAASRSGEDAPLLMVAPMVEQSELAWRILSRRHGAEVTVTPMFHAKMFATQEKYRNESWIFNESEDSPLVVQFCANDPNYLLQAAKLVEGNCAAVDLNLGCPQHIAKRGHYGAFLQNDWALTALMISTLAKNLTIPVTCKIRVFPSLEKSVEYALMIQDAGCKLLTVHGRLIGQKGSLTGLADWKKIRAIKKALHIPVIANGNILYYEDISKCMKETGVNGIMSAESNLCNPALFEDKFYASWYLTQEYLDIIDEFPNSATLSQAKSHLFKLYHAVLCIPSFFDLRESLGQNVQVWQDLKDIHAEVKRRLIEEYGDEELYTGEVVRNEEGLLVLPPWVAQPKLRKTEVSSPEKVDDMMEYGETTEPLSTKKGGKKRVADGDQQKEVTPKVKKGRTDVCPSDKCTNIFSEKCSQKVCKTCCKEKGCPAHSRKKKNVTGAGASVTSTPTATSSSSSTSPSSSSSSQCIIL